MNTVSHFKSDGNASSVEYNQALFENMVYFADVVLKVDACAGSVQVLEDKITNGKLSSLETLENFITYSKKVTHPDFFPCIEKRFSKEYAVGIKRTEVFENRTLVNGRYHSMQCVMTPCPDSQGAYFVTVRDIQPIIDDRENHCVEVKDDLERVTGVLSAAQIGLWNMVIDNPDDENVKLNVDPTAARIMGIPEGTGPEEAMKIWSGRVDPEYMDSVLFCIKKIKMGIPTEVIYTYNHPFFGKLTIRCGGIMDYMYSGSGVRIKGYHQDISEFNKELLSQVEIGHALQMHFYMVAELDLVNRKCKSLWDPNGIFRIGDINSGFMDFNFMRYYSFFTEESLEKFKKYSEPEIIASELKKKKFLLFEVETVEAGWFRMSFVPSRFSETGDVERCVFLLEYIDEEKRQELRRHELLKKALRREQRNRSVIMGIASIYHTLHILDLKENRIEEFKAPLYIHEYIQLHKNDSVADIVREFMHEKFAGKGLEIVLKFTDITTLQERMGKKSNIYLEVIDSDEVWFRLGFIRFDDFEDDFSKVIFVSQNIDEARRAQEQLVLRSMTDELTGAFNRHAYEDYIDKLCKLNKNGVGENVWLMGIDVNGLKQTNDTKGHNAGDELIVAVSDCISESIGSNGRLFRIGGDEFIVILHGDKEKISGILDKIEMKRAAWKGKFSDEVSFSKGIVCAKEMPGCTVSDMEKEADRRMYDDKRAYYSTKADRRKRV